MPQGDRKGTGLAPHIASLVCYLFPPVTSIIMMLTEKESRLVQFHAWQATTLTVLWVVTWVAMNILALIVGKMIGFLGEMVHRLIDLVHLTGLVLLTVGAIRAFRGEMWKIPYIGDFAEKKLGGDL